MEAHCRKVHLVLVYVLAGASQRSRGDGQLSLFHSPSTQFEFRASKLVWLLSERRLSCEDGGEDG